MDHCNHLVGGPTKPRGLSEIAIGEVTGLSFSTLLALALREGLACSSQSHLPHQPSKRRFAYVR